MTFFAPTQPKPNSLDRLVESMGVRAWKGRKV